MLNRYQLDAVCLLSVVCLEHKGDRSSFHSFTVDAKETFKLVL